MGHVLIVCATKKLRGRLGSATAHDAEPSTTMLVERELSEMRDCRFGPTANRSVLGIMNEFSFLADVYRRNDPGIDLLVMVRKLAATPCGPLHRRHISPDRELRAFLISAAQPPE